VLLGRRELVSLGSRDLEEEVDEDVTSTFSEDVAAAASAKAKRGTLMFIGIFVGVVSAIFFELKIRGLKGGLFILC
jgi:hypothetical protein